MEKIILIVVILALVILVGMALYSRVTRKNRIEKRKESTENEMEILREMIVLNRELRKMDVKQPDEPTFENNHTVSSLISTSATEEDYEEFLDMLSDKVKELYEEYQFAYFEPNEGDYVSGYMMQFVIPSTDPMLTKLFVESMDRGIDVSKLREKFAKELQEGNIIPLGDDIIIKDEGTGIPPINGGEDLNVMITFTTPAMEEARKEEEEEKAKVDA